MNEYPNAANLYCFPLIFWPSASIVLLFSWSSQLEKVLLLQRLVHSHIILLIILLDLHRSELFEQTALEPSLFIRVVVWIVSHLWSCWARRTVDKFLMK